MCEWNTLSPIYVIRRNNELIPDGRHLVYVDSCIANYVQKMNDLGIITVGCCCGHGKSEPQVLVDLESKELLERLNYSFEEYYIDGKLDSLLHYIPKEM